MKKSKFNLNIYKILTTAVFFLIFILIAEILYINFILTAPTPEPLATPKNNKVLFEQFDNFESSEVILELNDIGKTSPFK